MPFCSKCGKEIPKGSMCLKCGLEEIRKQTSYGNPRCEKCGSVKVATYEEVTSNPPTGWPTTNGEGLPVVYGFGKALLVTTFVCVECGHKSTDWLDLADVDEKLLP